MFENKNEKLKEEIEELQSKLRAVSNIFSQYDVRGYAVTVENINRILPGFQAKVEGIIKDEVAKHPGEMFGDNLKNEMKLQVGNQVTSFILNSRAQLAQMVEKYKEEEAKGNNSPMKTLFGGKKKGGASMLGGKLKMKKVSKKRQEEILKDIIKRSVAKRKSKKVGGFCGATFSPFVPPTAGTATSVATLTWAKPSLPSTSTVSKTASANLGKMSNADLNDAANTALKNSQTGGRSDKVVKEIVRKIRKQRGGICSSTFAPFEVNPIANAWKIGASCKTVSTQSGGKRGSVSKQVVKEIIGRIKSQKQKGGEALAPFVKYYPGEVVSFLDRGSSGKPVDMSSVNSAWSMGKTSCKSATQNGGRTKSSSGKKKVVKRKKQRGGCNDLAPFTSTSKSASLVKPTAQTGGKKSVSKKSGNSKSKMTKCETGMKKKIIKIRKKVVIIGDSSSSESSSDSD